MKKKENLEKICEYALDREDFRGIEPCKKCNLKVYKEPIVCFEPDNWYNCYIYFNYNNGKPCAKWEYKCLDRQDKESLK